MIRNGRAPETIYTRSFEKILGKYDCSGRGTGAGRGGCPSGSIIMASSCDSEGGLSGISAAADAVVRLTCCGAKPGSVTVSAVFPSDTEESLIKSYMQKCSDDIRRLAEGPFPDGLGIIPGTLTFSEGLKTPVITASASGMEGSLYRRKKIIPGNQIVMTGTAGWQGTLRLAERYKEKLQRHYSRDFLSPVLPGETGQADRAADTLNAAMAAVSAGAAEIFACGSGGVYSGLWELGKRAGLGLGAQLSAIPFRQETIEVSDYFNCDPYGLLSSGTLLIACEDGGFLTEEMARAGIPAVQIGYFTEGSDRVIIGREEERRFLTPFAGDSFYDACQNAARI